MCYLIRITFLVELCPHSHFFLVEPCPHDNFGSNHVPKVRSNYVQVEPCITSRHNSQAKNRRERLRVNSRMFTLGASMWLKLEEISTFLALPKAFWNGIWHKIVKYAEIARFIQHFGLFSRNKNLNCEKLRDAYAKNSYFLVQTNDVN